MRGARASLAGALGALWLASGCAACGEGGDGAGAGGPSSAGSSGGGASSTTTSSSTGGAGGAAPCPEGPLPPGVPEGWVRPPGAPCECDVFMSPDAGHMKAASPWIECGEGCLELQVDWTEDESYRLLGQHGGVGGGERYVAYTRYLSDKGPYELQIVKLPGTVVFDAIYQSRSEGWVIRPRVAGSSGHLVDLYASIDNGAGGRHSLHYVVPPGGGMPDPSLDAVVSWMPLEATLSSELWAMDLQAGYSWVWHELGYGVEMNPGYSSPDGRMVFGPRAVGSTVFFSTCCAGTPSAVMVWDPVEGARPLVSFPSMEAGGACCLETDGQTMVWYQASGYLEGNKYAEVALMRSPFATSAAALQPVVLRPAHKGGVIFGGGKVGGGFAFHGEAITGDNVRWVLTRLSDGHYWVIPPRPGFAWANLLYVDGEELAIVESANDGVYHATHWTMVRLSIASLGEPLPPGSGF